MRERIVAGNWKLHGDRAFSRSLLDEVVLDERKKMEIKKSTSSFFSFMMKMLSLGYQTKQ